MFSAATTPPKLFTLVALTALSVVSLNMFLPSLANIAADFEVDYGLASLSVAGYFAATAILQLILGPLSDRYGRRPILLLGMAIFVVASIGCALAPNIWLFLGFRLLQGAVVSGMALSRAVIRDTVPTHEAARLMAVIGMSIAVAPMVGPMFGGLLDELFGWRANFWAFAVFGVVTLWLCWSDLGETNVEPSTTFKAQFRSYPELYSSRRFWGYSICLAFSVGTFYVFLAGAPFVAASTFGLEPAILGFYLGSTTLGYFIGSWGATRLSDMWSMTRTMIAGRILSCLGLSLGLILVLAGIIHEYTYFGAAIFVGLGNGLTLPGANAGAVSVRPQLAGSASGASGAMTYAIGAVLTFMTGAVLTVANGPFVLMSIMLFCSVVSWIAAQYVRYVDELEAGADVSQS